MSLKSNFINGDKQLSYFLIQQENSHNIRQKPTKAYISLINMLIYREQRVSPVVELS